MMKYSLSLNPFLSEGDNLIMEWEWIKIREQKGKRCIQEHCWVLFSHIGS